MQAPQPRFAHLTPWARSVRLHARLLTCAAIGLALSAILPSGWPPVTRLLLGWNAGVILYLLMMARHFARADLDNIRQRAAEDDEGALILLFLTAGAALASLVAVVAELSGTKDAGAARMPHVALALATIVLSWVFIHTIFALHYAYEHYDEDGCAGLEFPGDQDPDYWDFLYFSMVIGMTFQVSDVAVADRQLRRMVLAQGAFSFLYNTVILALSVNIIASVT
jgi:uncharacterized membrane protein